MRGRVRAGWRRGGVCVWFFGTCEMACLPRSEVLRLSEGLAAGLHAKAKRSVKLFRKGLREACTYLQVTAGPLL
jgi:hypothetical protein